MAHLYHARISLLLISAIGLSTPTGCLFTNDFEPEAELICQSTADCPAARICVASIGRCVDNTDPCIQVDETQNSAERLPNGNACGGGRICVEGVCLQARCGDGVTTPPETCDGEPDCRTNCTRCGDGILDEGESCDSGLGNSDIEPDACRTTCMPAECGDGVRDSGEGCDHGQSNNDVQAGACRTHCALASCGDGILDPGELCDEGIKNSDVLPNVCRITCVPARCGDGILDEGEDCDDGSANSDVMPNACRTSCTHAACGDGTRDLDEACDDGSLNSNDAPGACRFSCDLPSCGDGVVDPGETCDDHNANNGDGCRADCLKVEICGDQFVDEGEDCDDGNLNPADGCDLCQNQTWESSVLISGSVQGRIASDYALELPRSVAIDGIGRVYIVDSLRVYRLDLDGTMQVIAGTGTTGFSGDGQAASQAQLHAPADVAVDPSGRIIIADSFNHRIRRVGNDGIIETIAGNGIEGTPEEGAIAIQTMLSYPSGVAVDESGRILIADSNNHCIRRIEYDGTLRTVAGTGVQNTSGDGGLAVQAELNSPKNIAVSSSGQIIFSEANRVRLIESDGTIKTLAGPTLSNDFLFPIGVGFHPDGRMVFVNSTSSASLYEIDLAGNIRRLPTDTSEDGLTSHRADGFNGLAIDPQGRIIVAEIANEQVVRFNENGFFEARLAGTGVSGFSGDNGPATSAALRGPDGLAFDLEGRLLIAETNSHRIRRVALDGTITTIAGTGVSGFDGDEGPASDAHLHWPTSMVVDDMGRVVFVDQGNFRVRRIEIDGTITTIAGSGMEGNGPDGQTATNTALGSWLAIGFDAAENLLIADASHHRVRRLEPDGTLITYAGTGQKGFAGDGGPAEQAQFDGPCALALDAQGRVLIADFFNNRIRRIDSVGTIHTIAGTGVSGLSGDGGPGIDAKLNGPIAMAADANGRIFFNDAWNGRVRVIDGAGIINTIAGTEMLGVERESFAGDGGRATNVAFEYLTGIAIDEQGRIVVGDAALMLDHPYERVCRIDNDGTLRTIVGQLHPPGPGSFSRASLYFPQSLANVDDKQMFTVGGQRRLVRIDLESSNVDVVLGYDQSAQEVQLQAAFAPLLQDSRGIAFDSVRMILVLTEYESGTLRIVELDTDNDGAIDDVSAWTQRSLPTPMLGPAGIFYEQNSGTFLVADERAHCVVRASIEDEVTTTNLYGTCGTLGSYPGYLNSPTHIISSPHSDALYVSDTGNHRVLRVSTNGVSELVIGDGSVSSAGEGAPARLFPIHSPRQLAMDSSGNLYVASARTLRMVANIDGDDEADGDDRVSTLFGVGDRLQFPESDSFCISALSLSASGDVYAADSCQGHLVRVSAVSALEN